MMMERTMKGGLSERGTSGLVRARLPVFSLVAFHG